MSPAGQAEEIQGPIIAVAVVNAVEGAVDWINGDEARLSASVWSRDEVTARRLAIVVSSSKAGRR